VRISSIRWGIIWIGIGLLFLAINLELLDTLVFPRLFALWPVLPIAIGIEMIFRRTKLYFLTFLSPLLIAGAFLFAAYAQGDWDPSVDGESWSVEETWRKWVWRTQGKKASHEIPPDSSITSLEIDLRCGSSELDLKPTSREIFQATTEYYRRSPRFEHNVEGGVGRIEYTNRERTHLGILGFNAATSKSQIYLADFIPIKARISAREDESSLDFTAMKLSSLDLDISSHLTKIRIGDLVDTVNIAIYGKTDHLSIGIPGEYGLTIRGDSTVLWPMLGKMGFVCGAYEYYTPNRDNNEDQIILLLGADIEGMSIENSQIYRASQ
jgi:hypothetical protein